MNDAEKLTRPGCLVLACSPRAGGNSDAAARLFAGQWPGTAGVLHLRDFHVEPCTGCGSCAATAKSLADKVSAAQEELEGSGPLLGCPLGRRDDGPLLLRALASAKQICIVSPVYFYHLPALFKALLDRCQCFWELRQAGMHGLFPRERQCAVMLIGARKTGDKLFAGSLLTLKYALAPLGIRLMEPLLLYGLDEPSALSGQPVVQNRILGYAADAAADV